MAGAHRGIVRSPRPGRQNQRRRAGRAWRRHSRRHDRNLLSFGANTIGRPLTATTLTYDPELPAYDILNLRVGLRRNEWDLSAYINNVANERALLSFDQERGTRARIGYLVNQPRTFGISTRLAF